MSDVIEAGPQPKHERLRELLIARMVPGRPIPSERELMVTHGVSRATVRRAIDTLVADGLLRRTQGLGTFAVLPRLESKLHLASFSQDMRQRGLAPSTRLVSSGPAVPPAEIRAWFALAQGRPAWRIVRVRLADGRPIAHEDGWYSAELLPGLDREDLAGASLYETLAARYGLQVDHAEQTLWAETATDELAAALDAPANTALLVFLRRSSTGGRPIEYVVSRYRGDRYQLQMDLSRGDPRGTTPPPHQLTEEMSWK